MRRIRRVTVIAACAAGLGLAASVLTGRHVCQTMSTDFPAAGGEPSSEERADALTSAAAIAGTSCTQGASPPQGLRRSAEAEASEPSPSTSSQPSSVKSRRGRAGRTAASVGRERDGFLDALGRGITRLGEHRYAVDPDALELALGNLELLARAARIAPDVRDGKPVGFRLVWVKADGPFASLGLRSDDILVSVNGLDIATPDQVLDAYGKLKRVRVLALELLRDGQRSTLEYVIR